MPSTMSVANDQNPDMGDSSNRPQRTKIENFLRFQQTPPYAGAKSLKSLSVDVCMSLPFPRASAIG